MKILLIQPAKAPVSIGGDDFQVFEPLALEYVAAGVQNDHDVKILDMRFEGDLEKTVTDFRPDVVGITAYTVHVNTARTLFKKIKELNSKIFTVAGGHHATVVPEDFFTPYVDLVVMGEGVFVFKEIISRLGKKEGIGGIPGTAYMDNSHSVYFQQGQVNNLDVFPFPARGLTAKYRKRYFCEWMKPLASIRTSKGCPFRCNFCALWKLTDGRYLKRKPEEIIRELSEIDEEYVFFADDESLVDTRRMQKLAGLIKEAGIKKRYFLYGRSDTIVKNAGLIEQWKNIGLERVFAGLEFFSNKDMQFINKGSSAEDNIEAVKILQSNDIEIYASFIVRPEHTREDFDSFKKYCRKLKLNFPTFAVLTPLPGTDLYEEEKDRLLSNNYDLFDFFHPLLPTHMPIEEFFDRLTTLYLKAKSPAKGLSFVMKFPVRDIPLLLRLTRKFTNQLRNAYKDY